MGPKYRALSEIPNSSSGLITGPRVHTRGSSKLVAAPAPTPIRPSASRPRRLGSDVWNQQSCSECSDEHARRRMAATPVIVNAVCLGLTAIYPGAEATGAAQWCEAPAGVAWAATLPDDGPCGGFFRDGKPLDWLRPAMR